MGDMDFTKVTSGNISDLLNPILDLVRQAHYIAVDTEFSGHGPSAAKHMDQRYQDLSKIIRTHTLFSFGLTVVTKQQNSSGWRFSSLEFLTRNQHSFQMDPNNIKFLAENGLDFTQIFQHGIPFSSGSTGGGEGEDVLRQLWHGILKIIKERQIPLVVHNGLLDIMYLYESFFAALPETLPTLVADLVEMFPAGIYDTKHLATEVVGEQKSFLAYLYCKYRRQSLDAPSWCVGPPLSPGMPLSPKLIDSTTHSLDDIVETPSMKRRKRMKKYDSNKKAKSGICGLYALRGWCKRGKECELSHDLQIILDRDLGTSAPKEEQALTTPQRLSPPTVEEPSMERRDHSAHFDAYMTAFVFCHFLSTIPSQDLALHINKLNLMRIDVPLRLAPSHYAKPSTEWTRIRSHLWPPSSSSS